MRTEGLITHADERPTAVIGIRQAVCDAARDVVGYEVLTGDPDAPPASARFCARACRALLDTIRAIARDLHQGAERAQSAR